MIYRYKEIDVQNIGEVLDNQAQKLWEPVSIFPHKWYIYPPEGGYGTLVKGFKIILRRPAMS